MERTLKVLSILEDVCAHYVENSKKANIEQIEQRKVARSTGQNEVTFSLIGPTIAMQGGISLIQTLYDILEPTKGRMDAQEVIQIVAMATKLSFLYKDESIIANRMKRLLEAYAPGFSVKDARQRK